jgi:transcriptional regulator with XRE-family HTH domain
MSLQRPDGDPADETSHRASTRPQTTSPTETEPEHGGEYVRRLRVAAGLTADEVAARAGIATQELDEIELHGTDKLSYDQIVSLVKATQPPRPSWWDEGHEHDLSLVNAHLAARTQEEVRYWNRIQTVRARIRLSRGPRPG